jgi:hypothetical protein
MEPIRRREHLHQLDGSVSQDFIRQSRSAGGNIIRQSRSAGGDFIRQNRSAGGNVIRQSRSAEGKSKPIHRRERHPSKPIHRRERHPSKPIRRRECHPSKPIHRRERHPSEPIRQRELHHRLDGSVSQDRSVRTDPPELTSSVGADPPGNTIRHHFGPSLLLPWTEPICGTINRHHQRGPPTGSTNRVHRQNGLMGTV